MTPLVVREVCFAASFIFVVGSTASALGFAKDTA